MLGPDGQPYPDYWLSYVFKQLVGTRVLNVTLSPKSKALEEVDMQIATHRHHKRHQSQKDLPKHDLKMNYNANISLEKHENINGYPNVQDQNTDYNHLNLGDNFTDFHNYFHKNMKNNNIQPVQAFAHCTPHSKLYPASYGSITIFAMNMKSTPVKINLPNIYRFQAELLDHYLMTPVGSGGLLSTSVALNGKVLKLTDKGELPVLNHLRYPTSGGIELPPTSYGFYVTVPAGIRFCNLP